MLKNLFWSKKILMGWITPRHPFMDPCWLRINNWYESVGRLSKLLVILFFSRNFLQSLCISVFSLMSVTLPFLHLPVITYLSVGALSGKCFSIDNEKQRWSSSPSSPLFSKFVLVASPSCLYQRRYPSNHYGVVTLCRRNLIGPRTILCRIFPLCPSLSHLR